MLDANGKRMLAYTAEILDVSPLYFCKSHIDEDGDLVEIEEEKEPEKEIYEENGVIQ